MCRKHCFYRFLRAVLHKRDMLMSRRMKNYRRVEFVKNLSESLRVSDGTDSYVDFGIALVVRIKLLFKQVSVVFIYIKYNNFFGWYFET